MRKILLILAVALGIFACDERESPLYEGISYLSFTSDISQDSTEVSFYFYPGENQIRIPVGIQLSGRLFTEDVQVKLSVDAERTTALEKNYTLPEVVFPAGATSDTVYVVLTNSAELASRKYKLMLKLEATADYELGPKKNWNNHIIFSDLASRPEWWNKTITNVYLGEWSQEKLEAFMFVTKVGDLTGKSSSELRALALKFKRAIKADPDNEMFKEKDGSTMTVTVIGE